ncbi:MAG: NAD(P)/FAD-dependent oxidoreductase [Hyphomicrobiales bacterium]
MNTGDLAEFDVVVVGAGVSGLYMLHRLRQDGWRVRVLEAGSDVGGTWYWNRYPGLRCDIESQQYSYSFSDDLQREWRWSERYAAREEVQRYLAHVAERFDLRRDIDFNTRVTTAVWDEAGGVWRIGRTPGGDLSARYLVMATGALSQPNLPDIPGIRDFAGAIYHTATWPKQPVDFTGLDVGVIGTGSSAIGAIPFIAKQAKSLTVFQRTANFVIPNWNRPLTPDVEQAFLERSGELRETMRSSAGGYLVEPEAEPLLGQPREKVLAVLDRHYRIGGLPFSHVYPDSKIDRRANDVVADFLRDKMRARVKNKAVAEKLLPRGFLFGTKRLCVDSGYLETFDRENVTLVDVNETPIERVDATGVIVGHRHVKLDALVCATGFDAVTGALTAIDIRGRGGVALKDRWRDGPSTFLGLSVAGFPNLFAIIGPQSPTILSNVIVSIEQHVEWVADLMAHARQRGVTRIEAEAEAEVAWNAKCEALAAATFYPEAKSWYMGANVPGKPRKMLAFVGGVGTYRDLCREIATQGYQGFRLE